MAQRKSPELPEWVTHELAEIDKQIEANRLRKEKQKPHVSSSDYGSRPNPSLITEGKKPR
jgi:hypothetical protein